MSQPSVLPVTNNFFIPRSGEKSQDGLVGDVSLTARLAASYGGNHAAWVDCLMAALAKLPATDNEWHQLGVREKHRALSERAEHVVLSTLIADADLTTTFIDRSRVDPGATYDMLHQNILMRVAMVESAWAAATTYEPRAVALMFAHFAYDVSPQILTTALAQRVSHVPVEVDINASTNFRRTLVELQRVFGRGDIRSALNTFQKFYDGRLSEPAIVEGQSTDQAKILIAAKRLGDAAVAQPTSGAIDEFVATIDRYTLGAARSVAMKLSTLLRVAERGDEQIKAQCDHIIRETTKDLRAEVGNGNLVVTSKLTRAVDEAASWLANRSMVTRPGIVRVDAEYKRRFEQAVNEFRLPAQQATGIDF